MPGEINRARLRRRIHDAMRDPEMRGELEALGQLHGVYARSPSALVEALVARVPGRVKSRLDAASESRDLKVSAGLAVAGIADPTFTLDGIGAAHSLGMAINYGKWEYAMDVPLFLLSAIPYVGDAVAKTALGVRIGRRVTKAGSAMRGLRRLLIQRTRFLGKAAYTADIFRSTIAVKFFKRFKNDPKFAGWVERNLEAVDVDADDIEDAMDGMMKAYRGNGVARRPATVDISHGKMAQPSTSDRTVRAQRSFWSEGNPNMRTTADDMSGASKYEARVLALRMGDSVSAVSSKTGKPMTVKLGKFLGAGNATHVYEIAGSPGQVIRLPFITQGLLKPGSTAKGLDEARSFAKGTIEMSPWYEKMETTKAASLIDWGPKGEFIISKFVDIVEDGTDFLRRIGKTPGTLRPADQRRLEDLENAVNEVLKRRKFGERGMYKGLEPRHHGGNTSFVPQSGARRQTQVGGADDFTSEARQFGWDGRSWVLLDWE